MFFLQSARGRAKLWRPVAAVGVALLLVGATPLRHRPQPQVAPGAPNILIIVTDDQRDGMRMLPRTRRIFRKGVRFTNAFATTPLCCPSRASILTGRYAHNHGVIANTLRDGAEKYDARTGLPYLLKSAGYTTGIVGKYLNEVPLEEAPPYFDRYVRTEGRAYYGGRWNVNGVVHQLPGYSTSVIADAASMFILEQAITGAPWFLVIATVAPHNPAVPEEKYARLKVGRWKGNPATNSRRSDEGKPDYIRKESYSLKDGRRLRRAQLRTLASVDDLVVKVFDTLRSTSQDRNTLAFFLSDNGMMWGEFGLLKKGYPYTPSVRVPMLMRWPERIRRAQVDARLVANIDIAPSVLDAIGLPQDHDVPMDGRSLLSREWR
ncbi:MAG TPA: sulfatase-like hydrolase/transferase, partial [Actinomycetota bacterium]|nr:sulfatase-like hydrolase/transferase [Actinomycetota bacterium]